jgi:hypothetical protein
MLSKCFLFAFAMLGVASHLHGQVLDKPEPLLLLQGVEAMREQTPPSWLHVRIEYNGAFSKGNAEHMVLFDREMRLFASTNADKPKRIVYDGKEVTHFDGHSGVDVRSFDSLLPDYLFDPRTLGLEGSWAWGVTIQNALHLKASRIELIGREQVGDKSAWHVRMIEDGEQNKCEIDLWLDDRNSFSVYRADEKWMNGARSTRSFYENTNYAWFPSRVETEEYDAKGTVRWKRKLSVLAAEAKSKLPASTWTMEALLAGVELQEWLPITDVRIPKLVGYWHDGSLGPPTVQEARPVPPKPNTKRTLVWVFMGLLFLSPWVALWFNKRRVRAEA